METENCCGGKNLLEWDLELEVSPLHYKVFISEAVLFYYF